MIQHFLILIANCAILVLIGRSFSIIFKVIKFFHFTHAISFTIGCYFTYFLSITLKFPLFVSIPISLAFGISSMLSINHFIYKPLEKRNLENWQMLIVSLGLYVVLQNVISMIWGDSTLSFRTWPVKEGYRFVGAYITGIQIITICVCIALIGFSWFFLERTSIGQKVKAVSSNPELSSTVGISKDQAVFWSFVIGTGLVSSVGLLISADTDMTPTMGFNWLLYGVVAIIIGGLGNLRYLVLGALLLASAQHLSTYYLDNKWMNAAAYIILIVFLYFKPYGFSGQPIQKVKI